MQVKHLYEDGGGVWSGGEEKNRGGRKQIDCVVSCRDFVLSLLKTRNLTHTQASPGQASPRVVAKDVSSHSKDIHSHLRMKQRGPNMKIYCMVKGEGVGRWSGGRS